MVKKIEICLQTSKQTSKCGGYRYMTENQYVIGVLYNTWITNYNPELILGASDVLDIQHSEFPERRQE